MDTPTYVAIGIAALSILCTFVGTWAVVKWRIKALEDHDDKCESEMKGCIKDLYEKRNEDRDRQNAERDANGLEHANMRANIAELMGMEPWFELLTDMVVSMMQSQGHKDTDKYRQRISTIRRKIKRSIM